MPNANTDITSEQIIDLIGCKSEEILKISAKDGIGIDEVFHAIINTIPSPTNKYENNTSRGLIFDSFYDQ